MDLTPNPPSARPTGRARGDRAPRWKARFACLIVAAWLGAGLVGVAGAQGTGGATDGEVDELMDVGEGAGVDTDRTPVAKPTEMWQQVHGARYERVEPIDGSVTSFDVDLFAVAFRNTRLGYAGGSRCADPPVREPDDSDSVYGERVSDCDPRVPVMYRFTDTAELGEVWEEVELPGGGKPGFVGEIAWIDSDRVLAVGGTGTYPRREVERRPNESFEEWAGRDPAGEGRAWLFESGSWEELDLSQERAEGMRGMTALDFHSTRTPEIGVAGALGQLWLWESGRFTEMVDRDASAAEMFAAHRFRGRVRQLRFLQDTNLQVFGVTAGCCGETPAQNIPRILAYDGTRWYVRAYGELSDLDGAQEEQEIEEPVTPNPDLPDSFYALGPPSARPGSGQCVAVVATPGGPAEDGERASVITESLLLNADGGMAGSAINLSERLAVRVLNPVFSTSLSTLRLVAADGDIRRRQRFPEDSDPRPHRCQQVPARTEGVPDWSVGELRTTRIEGLGARAVAMATHLEREQGVEAGFDESGNPFVEGEDRAVDPLKPHVFELPSYSLHALDVIGDSGSGWAAGDRGALLRLSEVGDEAQAARSEPSAPRVGRPRESELTDRGPFDGFRPIAEDVAAGAVPSLASRPRVPLPEPHLEPVGGVGTGSVSQIVMSRDRSEGWAKAGSSDGTPVVLRFTDGRWQRCEIVDSDRGPAHPACAGLKGMGSIGAMARVPMERGDDPSQQDEFEVVASSSGGALRYREGRWRTWKPEGANHLNDTVAHIAFTAPDDGWALTSSGPPNRVQSLYHFDGERWVDCSTSDDCDPIGRLPLDETISSDNQRRVSLGGLSVAGKRVYAFGVRRADGDGSPYPLIVYRDRGGMWTDDDGGYDPAFAHASGEEPQPPDVELRGEVQSLAVAERGDGDLEGFAIGEFGGQRVSMVWPLQSTNRLTVPTTTLMRLEDRSWERFSDDGPVRDYLGPMTSVRSRHERHLALPQTDGSVEHVFAQLGTSITGGGRIFRFDEAAGRFELLDSDRPASHIVQAAPTGALGALAPDGEGGFWMAVQSELQAYFFRYTDRSHEPVFSEAPMPVTEPRLQVTGVAGARNGTVWMSTDSAQLYRYDRMTGWDRVRVPGWDPGAVTTVSSPVHGVAVGPDGDGFAVGAGGRIARLGERGAILDRATGRACDLASPSPPCSTGRDLRVVDVAPDGSAIAGGDRLALLWRPRGKEFRAIKRPQAAAATGITAVSMPRADQAWIATSTGQVFRGTLVGQEWSWINEGVDAPVRDVALDPFGRGYAVGSRGLILERSGEGDRPWRPVHAGVFDDLTSVALPEGGGEGALIGGAAGLVLTLLDGRWEIARHRGFSTVTGHSVTGVVMMPGHDRGQTEAWVATGGQNGTNRLFHYSSTPKDALLRPDGRVESVPDAPASRPGEITFATLGKTECAADGHWECHEMQGTTEGFDRISRRTIAEIAERSRRDGGPVFSVFTGDAIDAASPRETPIEDIRQSRPSTEQAMQSGTTALRGSLKLRRWQEMFADRLERAGVPMLAAVGGQDLAETRVCSPAIATPCVTTREHAKAGDNLAWRDVLAGRRAPWGDGSDPSLVPEADLSFRPVRDSGLSLRGEGALDGAATHYAVDVERDGNAVMRLVFADTSLRSLSVSDAQQQPVEPAGQAMWLESVLCRRPGRAPTGEACTRPANLPAVVVSNTPTYSYGPGSGVETMTDAAAFEAILMRHRVTAGVAGRIGWNARYWATAPGLHEPCPGGSYQDEPPEPGVSACGEAAPGVGGGSVPEAGAPTQASLVADALSDAGAPAPPGIGPSGLDPTSLDPEHASDLTGADAPVSLLPFVVASGAGGQLANQAGQARDGFWEGYSIVRVPANGDPRGVIVEQRPVYDHVFLTAQERRLRPGQRVTLRGYGRGPITTNSFSSVNIHARFDRIDSDAVTHRYDLFEADPQRPYVPREDVSGEYVKLDPSIATVDRETGLVRAGRGDHEQTFAIAVLSVGEHAASYPMVFEPRRSFRAVREESPPVQAPTPQAPAPVPEVAGVPAAPPPPPPPPPPAPPPPSVSTPPFPALPALPSLGAPPSVSPPAPPSPPPTPPLPTPPTFSQAAPLGIAAEVGAIGVQGSVVPPSPPPVNPAPPGGSAARKEAKQRQAATAKSEEGGQEGEAGMQDGYEMDSAQGDMDRAQSSMTRHEPGSARHDAAPGRNAFSGREAAMRRGDRAPSFTVAASEQASAWSRGLVYGGGLGAAALILALGWSTLRPTPRRHSPPVPAPAVVRARRR